MNLEEYIKKLPKNIKDSINNCSNTEEIIRVLEENGIKITQENNCEQLSDDQLAIVTGGIDIKFLLQELFKFGADKIKELTKEDK